ncbi:MAG: 5'-nucleotidase, lipoprotein e(P4) family [Desulfosarcinaceae bacterium]|nr:5'-nucleotidase, lipoprotein e(P4) family [Desulfosarcinaceae bacterium]
MIRKMQNGLMMTGLVLAFTALLLLPGQRDAEAFSTKDLNEQLVMATLWMQTSAEYRALCYQTFNLARLNLQAFLSYYKGQKPVAVIVDADETVIDNSAYEAFLIGNDFGYSSKTWNPWMAAAQAEAVPGALDFLSYAKAQGVEIFYVTNRKMVGYEGTAKNLAALGFPFVDEKHLLLRTDTSDKQPRRDIVMADYEVAFLMGDNLNDFESVFAKKSVADRAAAVDERKAKWGSKFIVLPNPTYGEWEGAIYNYNWGASAAEKDKMRKELLKRWDYMP